MVFQNLLKRSIRRGVHHEGKRASDLRLAGMQFLELIAIEPSKVVETIEREFHTVNAPAPLAELSSDAV